MGRRREIGCEEREVVGARGHVDRHDHLGGLVTASGTADLPVAEVVSGILDSPYTRMPLWREDPDNVIGVLHAKSLLRELRTRDGNLDGLDVTALAAEPWFVPEQTLLLDQLEAFRARREHFALVVDEYGSLMGVVTLEDILEEIVGDIDDEVPALTVGTLQRLVGDTLRDVIDPRTRGRGA